MPNQQMPPVDPRESLRTLFGLQRQSPSVNPYLRGNTSDAQYDELIPEEDLYGAQDAIQQGQADRAYQYTPSRDSLRQQGTSRLKQLFAIEEAKTAPTRIKGDYDLQQEQMRGEYGVRAAQTRADAAAMERENQRAHSSEQGALNRADIGDRQQRSQKSMGQRQAAGAQATRDTQRISRLATGKENMPQSWWQMLTGTSQNKLNNAEIERLTQQQQGQEPPEASGGGALDTAFVSSVLQRMQSSGESLDDLIAAGFDADPAEMAAIRAQAGR